MMLLIFALGIVTGMWLPAVLAWVMTIGEHDHVSVRSARIENKRLDQLLGEDLDLVSPQWPPARPAGRHALKEDEGA
jgi:hypothetical protein